MAIITDKVDSIAGVDSSELAQRIAVLRRFKTLLTQQRDRFRSYLEILDKQKDVIESGNADALLSYVEIEEKIIADIFSIQKVIDPLEEMYHSVVSNFDPGNSIKTEDTEVPSLKAALENLKSEAVIRSTKNKELLSKRMMEFRLEISALRNNPYAAGRRRSVFSDGNTASLIDIHG
jgi:hypothetical protein